VSRPARAALGDLEPALVLAAAALLEVEPHGLDVGVGIGVVERRAQRGCEHQGRGLAEGLAEELQLGVPIDPFDDPPIHGPQRLARAQQLRGQHLEQVSFPCGAGQAQGRLRAVQDGRDQRGIGHASAHMVQKGLGLRALSAHRLRGSICADQVQHAGAVQLGDSPQLRPVAAEQCLQAIEVAAMLALVQVQLRHQRLLLPALLRGASRHGWEAPSRCRRPMR